VTGRPIQAPASPHAPNDPLTPVIRGNWIWAPLKRQWLVLTPEEKVRQEYILRLWYRYDYSFDQMDQERRTRHGRTSPKADIIVWQSPAAKADGRAPTIVVECKSDNVTIVPDDYEQGDSYARATEAEFLVAHNNKETRCFRVIRGVPGRREDIEDIPQREDLEDARRMAEIRRATKTFTREEFTRLLADSHSILRDNHKMDPGSAFDEISKILFIKMYIERTGDQEKFTTDYLDRYAEIRRRNLEEVMHDLFQDTKSYYRADDLFGEDDRLNISFATFKRIVAKLQRFNLAATGEDIKGIAFERFLGQTYRGQLGQYFTPRPIVDFMVEFMNPHENMLVCDPASGTGGFLIRFFDHVRLNIEGDIQAQKKAMRARIASERLGEVAAAERLNQEFARLNEGLDVSIPGSRLWAVANERIFGADAEPRAARTSKMNMIMHGDGHGGIHHHDGLIDTNGIFPGRFDLVLTNPPFGSKVGDDQIVGATPETQVTVDPALRADYEENYGHAYRERYDRMALAETNHQKLLDLFDLGKERSKVKSEVLFLERCLELLEPGGRVGIVVPDGVLNNPSLAFLRDYIEDRARILAVVSIPDKTFRSAKTTIKASLLFLEKLSEEDMTATETLRRQVADEENARLTPEVDALARACSVSWIQYERAREGRSRSPAALEALERAGPGLDEEALRAVKKEWRERRRALEDAPAVKARIAVREAFDCDVFMAVAERVGIRSSGREDPVNELPAILDKWRSFVANPHSITSDIRENIFRLPWSRLDRWDPSSFRPIEWECSDNILQPLGCGLVKRVEPVDRTVWDFDELTPITIHFDGTLEPRDLGDADDYTMDLFFAHPGDIVVSKIDLKNGAVAIVPDTLKNVVVTNHFVVYTPDTSRIFPLYLIRLIQTKFFKDYLWRKKVGSEGRKEVKIELFEATPIPLPDVDTQRKLVRDWLPIEREQASLSQRMRLVKDQLDAVLLRASRGSSG
jgi:type I restriction enzyme M protein